MLLTTTKQGITWIRCASTSIFHLLRLGRTDTKLHVSPSRKEWPSAISAQTASKSKVFQSARFARGQRNWSTALSGPKLSLKDCTVQRIKHLRTSSKISLKSWKKPVNLTTRFNSHKSCSIDYSTKNHNICWLHLETDSPKVNKKYRRRRKRRRKNSWIKSKHSPSQISRVKLNWMSAISRVSRRNASVIDQSKVWWRWQSKAVSICLFTQFWRSKSRNRNRLEGWSSIRTIPSRWTSWRQRLTLEHSTSAYRWRVCLRSKRWLGRSCQQSRVQMHLLPPSKFTKQSNCLPEMVKRTNITNCEASATCDLVEIRDLAVWREWMNLRNLIAKCAKMIQVT